MHYSKETLKGPLMSFVGTLREAKIRYRNLAMEPPGIRFSLVDPSQKDKAHRVLEGLGADVLGSDVPRAAFQVTVNGRDMHLVPHPDLFEKKTRQVVEQSLEIVRRRIDETGRKSQ